MYDGFCDSVGCMRPASGKVKTPEDEVIGQLCLKCWDEGVKTGKFRFKSWRPAQSFDELQFHPTPGTDAWVEATIRILKERIHGPS